MTEPMSDGDEIAVLAEVITAGIPKALSRLEAGQFKRRADSLIRGFVSSLKAKLSPPIPPDVQAAMERYKKQEAAEKISDLEASPYYKSGSGLGGFKRTSDLLTIVRHFASHHGKDVA